MSNVRHIREEGKRRVNPHRAGRSIGVIGQSLGAHSKAREHRLNADQMRSLDSMYNTHPAIQAARSVLHSQLLSGGLQLSRGGQVLQKVRFGETDPNTGTRMAGITADWTHHLDTHWLPFARDVIDAFLKWGLCPVAVTVMHEDNHKRSIDALKASLGMASSDNPQKKQKLPAPPKVLIPVVPQPETYQIAWSSERTEYARDYVVYAMSEHSGHYMDETVKVFVQQHPDQDGNINSPLSSVYDMGSFVSSLVELAFLSEIARSQPTLTTQLRKPDKGSELAPGNLFFDTESREMASQQNEQDSSAAVRALEMQSRLCDIINKYQTTNPAAGHSQAARGASASIQPPDVQPKLFVLPKEHEIAQSPQLPQPRGDLEALMRFGVDQFCSALGVPAALVFEGRFSNNSTTQLALLNSTVAQLAKAVNSVLTYMYNTLYDEGGVTDTADAPQLKLHTAPLAASNEVASLYAAQIIDLETAMPAAMHALGMTADEVDAAMQRARTRQDERRYVADAKSDETADKQDEVP